MLGLDKLLEGFILEQSLRAPDLILLIGSELLPREDGFGRGVRELYRRLVFNFPHFAPVVALLESPLYLVAPKGVPAAPRRRVLLTLASLMYHLRVEVVLQTYNANGAVFIREVIPNNPQILVMMRNFLANRLVFINDRFKDWVVLVVINQALHDHLLALGVLHHPSKGGWDHLHDMMPR